MNIKQYFVFILICFSQVIGDIDHSIAWFVNLSYCLCVHLLLNVYSCLLLIFNEIKVFCCWLWNISVYIEYQPLFQIHHLQISSYLGLPVYLVDSTFDILKVLMLTCPILSFVIVVLFVFCAFGVDPRNFRQFYSYTLSIISFEFLGLDTFGVFRDPKCSTLFHMFILHFPPIFIEKTTFFEKTIFIKPSSITLQTQFNYKCGIFFLSFFFFSIDCPVPQFWLLLFSYKIGNQEVWDLQIQLCSHTPELFCFFGGGFFEKL